jgi:hypothetical protein
VWRGSIINAPKRDGVKTGQHICRCFSARFLKVLEDIVLYMEDILQSPKEYTKKVILTHTIIKILKLEIKLQFKKAAPLKKRTHKLQKGDS